MISAELGIFNAVTAVATILSWCKMQWCHITGWDPLLRTIC